MSKQETMSTEQFNAAIGKRKSFDDAPKKKSGEPNKGERAYGLELAMQKNEGRIHWFAFQPITLKLAFDTRYTPDYVVQGCDGGPLTMIDVKGRKGNGYWCEEDAKIKIKVAAEKFPMFRFAIVWPAKDGVWERAEF